MDYGICTLSIVPCRSEPDDRSEMVTQLLFGELVKILQVKEKWLKIQIDTDGYKAWVDRKQIEPIDSSMYKKLKSAEDQLTDEFLTPVHSRQSGNFFPLPAGAHIRGLNDKHEVNYGSKYFKIDGALRKPPQKVMRAQLIQDALMFIHTPYLWGGKSSLGIDCSGYTQLMYALNGIQIPRDADQQAELGHGLSFIEEAEEGDLAFFDNQEGKIIHVGLMLKEHRIIHASGEVRIDRIDHQGIFREDTNEYSHSLRIIKRII